MGTLKQIQEYTRTQYVSKVASQPTPERTGIKTQIWGVSQEGLSKKVGEYLSEDGERFSKYI